LIVRVGQVCACAEANGAATIVAAPALIKLRREILFTTFPPVGVMPVDCVWIVGRTPGSGDLRRLVRLCSFRKLAAWADGFRCSLESGFLTLRSRDHGTVKHSHGSSQQI
jgi:hypothetical protein